MIAALLSPLSVQFNDAVFGKHRGDALDAEFGRFLHDEVHALAAGNRLDQVNLQRRLGASLDALTQRQADTVPADARYGCWPFGTFSIEYDEPVANVHAQHRAEVSCTIPVEFNLDAVDQCAGNK